MTLILQRAHALAAEAARRDFPSFLAYVGADEQGRPFDRRELDALAWEFAEECFAENVPCGLMLPMGGGKTSLACYRAAFEIGRDPNVLISIVSYAEDRACELVDLVRRIIHRDAYARVFPHVRIVAGKDASDRFTVERKGLSNNPTCAAFGVLTGTGTRTSFLILDDVVTIKNAILEPANRQRVADALRTTWMSRHKLGGKSRRCTVWLQTAYHCADAAAVLREDQTAGWRWLIVRAEEPYESLAWEKWREGLCVETGTVASPFPAEVLRQRAAQMGAIAAARGLANRPVSGEECPFREEHFKGPAPLRPEDYAMRIAFADPAGDASRAKIEGDWCAFVAIGYRRDERVWEVYLAERMRGTPSQQANFIARKAVQGRVQVVWQEATKDETLVEVTQRAIRDLGRPIPVRPEKPVVNKEVRIAQVLEPALSARPPLLRVCGAAFPELRAEALSFPAAAHDDLLDAFAGAFAKAPSARPAGSPADETRPDDPGDDEEERPGRALPWRLRGPRRGEDDWRLR